MRLNLYRTRHVWVVVPDRMRAPQAAADEFGPLEFLGEVDGRGLGPDEIARILKAIDATSFAMICEEAAQALLRWPTGAPA